MTTTWSYSRYAVYATCPLQFKLHYIDKITEPPSPTMERGNRIHQGMAEFLLRKPGSTTPLEAALSEKQVRFIAELNNFPGKHIEQKWGFSKRWIATDWMSKEVWYRGILDVGVPYEDDTYEAIDWKTGKRYGSNDEQMEIFGLMVMCKYPTVKHVTTRLVYLDSGEEQFAEYPAADKELLKAKWEAKVAPMLVDTTFVPRPNDKCKWCNFSKSKLGNCRFG